MSPAAVPALEALGRDCRALGKRGNPRRRHHIPLAWCGAMNLRMLAPVIVGAAAVASCRPEWSAESPLLMEAE
jgi:hypothetical protein